MSDNRPSDCRFRLQDEGKAYPRSRCVACGRTIATGLGTICYHVEKPDAADEITRLNAALAEHESGKSFTRLHEIADRWCDKAKELEEQLAEAREIIELYAGSRWWLPEQPQPGSLLHRARAFLAAQESKCLTSNSTAI